MNEYSDDGDLGLVQRVEVKRRQTLTFTSKEDFPFDTLIVDACHCYDKARPKPVFYIIFNYEMTAAFIVEGDTYPYWKKVERFDTQKNRKRLFYECPLDKVRVEKIT